MILDAYIDDVSIVYNVLYRIDIVKGKKLALVADTIPEDTEVFASQDKVLGIEVIGNVIKIDALTEGSSKIRIMKSEKETTREILINVVGSVGTPAVSLNAEFGAAIPR